MLLEHMLEGERWGNKSRSQRNRKQVNRLTNATRIEQVGDVRGGRPPENLVSMSFTTLAIQACRVTQIEHPQTRREKPNRSVIARTPTTSPPATVTNPVE